MLSLSSSCPLFLLSPGMVFGCWVQCVNSRITCRHSNLKAPACDDWFCFFHLVLLRIKSRMYDSYLPPSPLAVFSLVPTIASVLCNCASLFSAKHWYSPKAVFGVEKHFIYFFKFFKFILWLSLIIKKDCWAQVGDDEIKYWMLISQICLHWGLLIYSIYTKYETKMIIIFTIIYTCS